MIDGKAGRAWLVALLLAGAGCADEKASTQVISGKVTTSGAVAVRAVRGDVVVTASQIRTDGSFTMVLPVAGERYRLEVMTTSGVRHVYSQAESGALADLSFRICEPTEPYDLGGLGPNVGVDGTSGSGGGSGGGSGSEEPVPEPWPCAPDDPACSGPTEPCSDPLDPTCGLPPTPGCADPADPYCFCDATGECPPPFCGSTEPGNPGQPEDPDAPTSGGDGSSGWDPTCGCAFDDQDCWPTPQEPACDLAGGTCEPGGPGGITPEHPPGDFGCGIEPGGDTPTESPPTDDPDGDGPVPLPVPEEPNA